MHSPIANQLLDPESTVHRVNHCFEFVWFIGRARVDPDALDQVLTSLDRLWPSEPERPFPLPSGVQVLKYSLCVVANACWIEICRNIDLPLREQLGELLNTA